VHDGVGTITLNNPVLKNAATPTMVREIMARFYAAGVFIFMTQRRLARLELFPTPTLTLPARQRCGSPIPLAIKL
jgi:hypothetical protein